MTTPQHAGGTSTCKTAICVKPRRAPSGPLKYRKGDETWTGVGSQPSWVRQHLALGETLEELRENIQDAYELMVTLERTPAPPAAQPS